VLTVFEGMGKSAMKSLRVALFSAALVLLAATTPAQATTEITSGSYTGSSFNSAGGEFSLGPGSYEISLAFSQPVSDVSGWVEKVFTYNDYCNLGEGEFYCGGDDDAIIPLFAMVTPQLYQLVLTVNGPRTVHGAPGDIVVREDQSDSCCTYGLDFTSGSPGRFTLSYAAIPEAPTWALLLAGFGLLGAALRRRPHQLRAA